MLNITTARDKKRAAICSAIRQKRPIEFYYHGGYRTVEPFCLGIVLKGDADNESLMCYQTGGFSDLREAVGWKLYRASEMEDIEVLKEHFTGDRPGYDLDHISMAKMICWVTFMSKPEAAIKAEPKEEPKIETSPLPPYEPTPEPQPVVRYITHNELMERFRFAHPMPIPELGAMLWPEPLAKPFPERAASKIWPSTPVFGDTHYLLGQTA
jgi:hypothetical protein